MAHDVSVIGLYILDVLGRHLEPDGDAAGRLTHLVGDGDGITHHNIVVQKAGADHLRKSGGEASHTEWAG